MRPSRQSTVSHSMNVYIAHTRFWMWEVSSWCYVLTSLAPLLSPSQKHTHAWLSLTRLTRIFIPVQQKNWTHHHIKGPIQFRTQFVIRLIYRLTIFNFRPANSNTHADKLAIAPRVLANADVARTFRLQTNIYDFDQYETSWRKLHVASLSLSLYLCLYIYRRIWSDQNCIHYELSMHILSRQQREWEVSLENDFMPFVLVEIMHLREM